MQLSHSFQHPQEVLLVQFSLYVHKGNLKAHSFHLKVELLMQIFSFKWMKNKFRSIRNRLYNIRLQQWNRIVEMLENICLHGHCDERYWCLMYLASIQVYVAVVALRFAPICLPPPPPPPPSLHTPPPSQAAQLRSVLDRQPYRQVTRALQPRSLAV